MIKDFEPSDITKLPSMNIDKDILTKYVPSWEKCLKEIHEKVQDELAKDDPNSGNWLK